ncbi:MAG: acetate/propionate family kinase, partial [Candidatus Binatia bacterium]
MKVVTVNTGSSSYRLAAFESGESPPRRIASVRRERGEASFEESLRAFLREHRLGEVAAVAHRVVHGGERLVRSTLVDAAVEAEIERLGSLAPLHNPPALEAIRRTRAALGAAAAQVAVFDTAFFASIPEVAAAYALPADLARRHGIRRYGYHGLAHEAM